MRKYGWLATAALAALPLVNGSSASAAVAVVDQSRVIHIDGQGVNNPSSKGTPFDQTLTATPFAAFNQSLSNSSQAPAIGAINGDLTTASASQNSTLTATSSTLHLQVNGAGSANVNNGTGGVNSSYFLLFTLDAPGTYTLTEQQNDIIDGVAAAVDLPNQGARLLAGSQPQLFPTPTDRTFPTQSLTPNLQTTALAGTSHTFTGTLAAGTYTLEGGIFGTPVSATTNGTYSLDFTVTSNSVSSVPLPNAAWMGLLTLGVTVAGWRIRRIIA